MPPVAAAFGAIGTAIAGAGSAVLATGTSVLGGIAAAGTSVIGGLSAAGTSVIGGLSAAAPQVAGIAQAGKQLYGMFQTPDQPTGPQPTRQPARTSVIPTNIMNTLPNLIRPPAPPQIITTPPMTVKAPENLLMKYAPWIAAAVIGYFVLGRK